MLMRKIGMGNRFAALTEYHGLIKAHGIIAAITFLFIVPAAIMIARFYGRNPGRALRMHIYLQIITVGLSTAVFVLGYFAVGPARSLTNPHHGIGVAIYVLILVQALGGRWIYGKEKGRVRTRMPLKLVLHQWLGRATALLGIVQVPLGLTLYGSPEFTFILYTLWMTVLLVWYFVLSYRAQAGVPGLVRTSSVHGTVIEDRKTSRWSGWLAPLAAGGAAAALLARRRSKRSDEREEVVSTRRNSRRDSRRDSESFIEEDEKFEEKKEGGGILGYALKGAAVLGAGALAKTWWDRRQEKKQQKEEYSSVAHDTPSRRHRRHGSDISEDTIEIDRLEAGRRPGGPILPGPGNPVVAASALSAAAPHPITPSRVRPGRASSFDSASYTDSLSPSRRPQSPSHKLRNTIFAGLGAGFIANRWKARKDRKEQERLDRLAEEERLSRIGGGQTPSRYTGDGIPPPRRHRISRTQESSELSSVIDDPHHIRPGAIPPIPAALGGGIAGAGLASQSRSRHDISSAPPAAYPPPPPNFPGTPNYPAPPENYPPPQQATMPPQPVDPVGILHHDSGSESYVSAGGQPHRRHSSRRRHDGEIAAAAAVAGAAGLAAEEELRRRRSRSRSQSQGPANTPPVSVKVKMHGDRDRNVTLRRLTEEEAAAEREARRSERRRRRADSLSSLSGTDTASNRRRYRRDEREAEERAGSRASGPPPQMQPLSPPNPAFAAGRRPKDSAYYSGRPEGSAAAAAGPRSSGGVAGGGVGRMSSPESHGTWSGLSPGSAGESVDPAERRRRRRLERNQRPGTVEFN
jgi:hypothetical protein